MASAAVAQGWEATVEPPAPVSAWREISTGATASINGWAAYSSSTFAPFGDLATDGFRVRLGSGYGRYHYTTALPTHGDCRYGNGRSTEVRGRTSFSDILAGYQLSAGQLTVKAYAGLASDSQDLSTRDVCNASQGLDYGPKAVIEGWLNITPKVWAAVDGSWTAAHAGYAASSAWGIAYWMTSRSASKRAQRAMLPESSSIVVCSPAMSGPGAKHPSPVASQATVLTSAMSRANGHGARSTCRFAIDP